LLLQVRNRNSEEYNVLKIQLEGIIEELERHFEQVRLCLIETSSVAGCMKTLLNDQQPYA
jgi:hypothetical protein